MNYKVYTFFLSLNPSSLKEIQGENLHNFKKILLMMYVYHKAAFTFEVSLSASTYDARWMYFNFTHIVGSIDLHNSLQTFSIRIVWQWKTVKGISALNTTQGKKNEVHLQKRHQNEEQCSAKQKHNIRSILFIKVLWTHISCNTKNSSFRQKQR